MSKVLPAITALGTTWLVEIFTELTDEKADETSGLVRLFLADFEAKYSRFKPDSTVSTLNQTGRLENPDQTTLELLALGQQLYRDTSGIFNMLVGEHLIARGYDADYSFAPKQEPTTIPSPLEALTLSENLITLTAGHLDLGGYGKGFVIDLLAKFLEEQGYPHFLINGGGDIYASSDKGEPIEIYLEHPSNHGIYIAKTTLKNQGFAASSTHKRRWKVSGKEYSHIVDTTIIPTPSSEDKKTPSSSDQAKDTLGIYTKTSTAVIADAWSTTLLISSPKNHLEALAQAKISFALFNTADNTLQKHHEF